MIYKNFLRQLSTTTLAAITFFSFAQSVSANYYNTTSDEEFEKLLSMYKSDPGLLRNQPKILKSLNEEQLVKAIQSLDLDHFHYLHPVLIKGHEIPSILGQQNDDIKIAAVRSGKLTLIPSQIDDVDTAGWIYIEGKSADEIDGVAGIFDANDELVFMYRDTGSERYDENVSDLDGGKILKELEFTDANNNKRYAYVVQGLAKADLVDYVSFDLATGKADTTFYNFQVDPKNILVFKDFKANVGDWQDHRLLDSVFFQIKSGVFTRWTNIELNNFDNFEAIPVAVKDGPVRAAALLKIWIKYGNIPLMRIWTQLNIYDQSLQLPLRIQIPGGDILAKTLVNPNINFILDFNGYEGARVAAAGTEEGQFGIVDGKMDKIEKSAYLTSQEPWVWMESGHSWDIFVTAELPKTWPAKLELAYIDDFENHWENETFPGAWPRAGFTISELPTDTLDFTIDINLRFPDTVGKAGPHEFGRMALNPPTLTTHDVGL